MFDSEDQLRWLRMERGHDLGLAKNDRLLDLVEQLEDELDELSWDIDVAEGERDEAEERVARLRTLLAEHGIADDEDED